MAPSGSASHATPELTPYRRRAPEHEALWRCVHDHLPAFLSEVAAAERTLPSYVLEELEGFLACGQLEHGFMRVACDGCGFARLVAFSCKGRGICPSCVARRMADTAAQLVDHVLPKAPVRQWVLSVPAPLRYLLAWDTALCAEVVRIFMSAVRRHLVSAAKHEGLVKRRRDAHFGAVCMVQRWGGSANLNLHLHALVLDGVYVAPDTPSEPPVFAALPEPDQGAVAAVAWQVCEEVVALLRERGQWLDAAPEDDAFAAQEPLLAELYAASIAGTLTLGGKSGQRQLRLYGTAARPVDEATSKVKNAYGFDVHAAVRISAADRSALERLARYVTRPPLSKGRLERQPDARYRIALKTPWRDGTSHIVLSGPELIGRLAALVPPPRFHLTRYFGVLASRAKLRAAVVPGYRDDEVSRCTAGHDSDRLDHVDDDTSTPATRRRMAWAKLLARVFAIDVLACPRCASRLQRVEVCTEPSRIKAVMARCTGPPDDAGLGVA